MGQRFPLHASASGKVLLATYDEERLERFLLEPLVRFTPSTIATAEALRSELERVRELRYAFVIDEEEEGLSGVATGIHGLTDELIGVLTVSGPTQRLDPHRGGHATDHLLGAAGQIESVLRRGRESASVLEVISEDKRLTRGARPAGSLTRALAVAPITGSAAKNTAPSRVPVASTEKP